MYVNDILSCSAYEGVQPCELLVTGSILVITVPSLTGYATFLPIKGGIMVKRSRVLSLNRRISLSTYIFLQYRLTSSRSEHCRDIL